MDIRILTSKSLSFKDFLADHNMKYLFLCIAMVYASSAYSQGFDYEAAVEASGYVSSENELPFWMYTNASRALGQTSSFSSTAGTIASYSFNENSALYAGASAYYRNDVQNEFQRKELYIEFKNRWLAITAGAKQTEEVAQELSSTNKNFLWSQNSRPLPGVQIGTSAPLRLNTIFSIEGAVAHYQLNDARYVANTRLHYKYLTVLARINEHNSITAKIQHVAQWAGTSPQFGELPNDLSAFVDVFFAKEAQESGETGEVANAVGNHIGTYLLDYELKAGFGALSLYHEHPFEDGSGTRLANFPDGVWGAYYQPTNRSLVSGVLYEYTTTKDQSGAFGVGQDNYFGNRIYRSGYSYEGVIIGFPFIQNDPSLELDENTIAIVSNRVSVHHVGVAGTFKGIQWKYKSSFAQSFGRFINPFPEVITTSHHFLEAAYTTNAFGTFTVVMGLDTSNLTDTVYGGGIQYRYNF